MTTKAQIQLHLSCCIDFIASKGLSGELIDFFPKSDKEDIKHYILIKELQEK